MWFAESWTQHDKAEFRAEREQPKNGYSLELDWNSRGGSGVGKMGEGLNQNFFFRFLFFIADTSRLTGLMINH